MAGKPFKVGRFAHTLRMRLMKEHAGIDVDATYEDDLMANEPVKAEHEQEAWDPDDEQKYGTDPGVHKVKGIHRQTATGALFRTGLDGLEQGAIHNCIASISTLIYRQPPMDPAKQGLGLA